MAYVVSFVGIVAAMAIMVVSAMMNARYAMSLATADIDRYLLAGGALFADVGKALAWIYFAGAAARREWLAASASLVMFVLCMSLAVAGSVGFIAAQRAASTGGVVVRSDTLKDLRSEKTRKEARLAAIGTVESVTVIEKRIEAAKQDVRFARTKSCTEATNGDSRVFCSGLKNVEGELAKSREAMQLEREIVDLGSRISKFGDVATSATSGSGDVQSAFIARVTGWNVWSVQLWLQLLLVGVIEAGACFMLYAAMNHGQAAFAARRGDRIEAVAVEPVRVADVSAVTREAITAEVASATVAGPPASTVADGNDNQSRDVVVMPQEATTGSVVQFMRERCSFDPEAMIEQAELVTAYGEWCQAKSCLAHEGETLARMLDVIAAQTELPRKRHGETVYWLGVGLTSTARRRVRRKAASE